MGATPRGAGTSYGAATDNPPLQSCLFQESVSCTSYEDLLEAAASSSTDCRESLAQNSVQSQDERWSLLGEPQAQSQLPQVPQEDGTP